MFETFGFETATPQQVSVWFALALGLAFGGLAQLTRFCFRRALVGDDRKQAAGVWFTGLAVAVLATQLANAAGILSFDTHRFMTPDLPWLAIVLGGLAFGGGMVLTQGCVSRLTVLTGSGNLRALCVIIVFAIVAHATLKGVLAPLRTSLASVTLPMGDAISLANLPGGAWFWSGLITVLALSVALRSGNRALPLLGAALIGGLAALGWIGTGFVLLDEFDPIAMESLSFTAPMSETLFFTVASTAIPAGFGTGLIAGVLMGSAIAALLSGSFKWVSFESPRQTGRYLSGAALMGVGGVLAGGCTVGAGLSGIPSLSVAALLALASISAGALATHGLLTRSRDANDGSTTTQGLQPAE